MSQQQWTQDDKELIMWTLNYIKSMTYTRNDKFFSDLVDEILLGPYSPRARSGELQDGLRLMKALVELQNSKDI